jgi:hypothetical protein
MNAILIMKNKGKTSENTFIVSLGLLVVIV